MVERAFDLFGTEIFINDYIACTINSAISNLCYFKVMNILPNGSLVINRGCNMVSSNLDKYIICITKCGKTILTTPYLNCIKLTENQINTIKSIDTGYKQYLIDYDETRKNSTPDEILLLPPKVAKCDWISNKFNQ